MKKTTKIIVTGAVCAALAATSFAAGTLVNIAVDPSIKILVNGEEFKPKDVNGNDVMVFTYEGTTYAPLRALAEAYGLEVGYDSNRKMATVSEPGMSRTTTYNDTTPSGGTIGEQNALAKANSSLRVMAFSYEGLVGQLEYEGFSHDEAVYGADNCGADWYEQAVAKAKSYLEFTSFSREGLKNQLEYEGFTEDQVKYALDEIGY